MTRYGPTVVDGVIVVETETETVEIGDLECVLAVLGGPAWTITYSEWEKHQNPAIDTSDEGITLDVTDVIHAMTFDESFVEALQALPADSPSRSRDAVSPRLGLFLGRLLENLAHGLK